MTLNTLFDTHAYIDTLERAGVPRNHAVAISKANQEMLAETLRSGLATKDDVVSLQHSINGLDKRIDSLDKKIDLVESNLNRRIDGLDSKLDKVSLQITIRLGSMIVIAVGVVSAMIKLF